MEPTSRILRRSEPLAVDRRKAIYRKLPLELYELEAESGEDESIHVDLNLDQIED